jgi:hypothetical protein
VCGGDGRLGDFGNSCRATVVRFPLAAAILILVLGMRIKEKRKRLIQVEHIVLINMKFKLYLKY